MRTLEWSELGGEYRQRFYEQADYLIERGYVTDASREALAAKVYEAYMRRKKEEHDKGSID